MASPSLFFTIIFFSCWLCGKTFGEKNYKKRNFARVGLVSYIIFKIFMTNI